MNKATKSIFGITAAVAAFALVGATGAYAAETIGTVTGKDGDVKDLVSISAEVTAVDGSHVSIVDVASDESYETSFGPSWHTREYEVGENVELVAVVTESENNDNDHNLQVLEIDGTELRESFEGKPVWAGTRGGGEGMGDGMGKRMGGNGNGDCTLTTAE